MQESALESRTPSVLEMIEKAEVVRVEGNAAFQVRHRDGLQCLTAPARSLVVVTLALACLAVCCVSPGWQV